MIIERARIMRAEMERGAGDWSDEKALIFMEFYPIWRPGIEYPMGMRLRYEDKLYRVRQLHTSLEIYPPPTAPALYEEVAAPGQGDSPSNPIPYNNNMALEEGKYYIQFDVIYICTRSTGIAVFNNLADLVGLYVEVYVG